MDDIPVPAVDAYERAEEARREGRIDVAVTLYQAALAEPDGGLSPKQRRTAHIQSLKDGRRLGQWAQTEVMARRAIAESAKLCEAHLSLGEALLHLGRPAEAEAALRQALALDPAQDAARGLLALLPALAGAPPSRAPTTRPRPWPMKSTAFQDPRFLVWKYLLRHRPRTAFIRPETVFLTLGSCFAQNLAHRLRAQGYTAHSEEIGEEVNSTYANRCLLRWLEDGPVDDATRAVDTAFGPAIRERLRAGFASSQVVVLTLGVAANFFDAEGRFVFMQLRTRTSTEALSGMTMRTSTVAENVENIGWVIDAIRRLAGKDVTIVLTLSPVPMGGTSEFDSAVIADCLSKSTLRVACHEAIAARADERLIYWPSFEIVRWLGPHFGQDIPPVYGADDGNTRHVSTWIVDLIISLFLESHAEPAAA